MFTLLPAAMLSVLAPTVTPAPSPIVVEGRASVSTPERWTIAPDPALERRYGARPAKSLNRVTVRF